MLLVLAALLLAEEDLAAPPETAAAPASLSAPAAAAPQEQEEAAETPARTAEASVEAAAGLRGERRAGVLARTAADGVVISLGVVRSEGPKAPERDELRFALQTPHAHAEVRAVPAAAGYLRGAAEAGVHGETWGLVLDGRLARLGRESLAAVGLRVEVEGPLREDLRAGATLAGSLLSLTSPAPRTGMLSTAADPWTRWGESTLDWAQRGELSGWVSRDFGSVSLTPALSLSVPARTDLEVRAAFGAELQLGAVKLRAELSCARALVQGLLLGEASFGVAVQLR